MTLYIAQFATIANSLCYFALSVYLFSYTALLVHELGHFSVAHYFGMPVASISFGTGKEELSFTWKGEVFRFNRWPTSGFVTRVYPSRTKWKNILFILAGPAGNMLLAPLVFSDHLFLHSMGLVSLMIGAINLIPTPNGDSDGSSALREFQRDSTGGLTRRPL